MLSHFSCIQPFATPWTVAYQAPQSMGFSRQEYWSGLSCPPPGDTPDPGVKPKSLAFPALAGGCFITSATWGALLRLKWNLNQAKYGILSFSRAGKPQPPVRGWATWASPHSTPILDTGWSRLHPPSSPGPTLSSLFPGPPPRCAQCYGMRSVWSLDILGHLEQTLPACVSLLVPATTQLPPSHAGSPAGPLALTSSAPGISFTPRRWLDLLGRVDPFLELADMEGWPSPQE